MIQEIAAKPVGTNHFVTKLADQFRGQANATTVYASPVERAGVTVIPVAKVGYCFAGGGGRASEEHGAAGGGAMVASPLGYIELKNGGSRFRPIVNESIVAPLALGGGICAALLLRHLLKSLVTQSRRREEPK